MPYRSIYCNVEVSTSKGRVLPLDDVHLSESLFGGSSLRLQVDTETASSFAIGDRVKLRVEPNEGESGNAADFLLWCSSIVIHRDGAGEYATLEARDPLGFCLCDTEFRTHAGNIALFQLLDAVLSRHAGKLESLPKATGASPTVSLEWLFQSNESGANFISRLALAVGCRAYWCRDRFKAAEIGKGLDPASGATDLVLGQDLVNMTTILGHCLPDKRVSWIDRVTRAVQSSRYSSDPSSNPVTDDELIGRVGAPYTPLPPAHLEAEIPATRASTLVADSIRADIAVGDPVNLGEEDTRVITEIDHQIRSTGSYSNRMVCVPRDVWGIGTTRSITGTIGPFQAEITHNSDPSGLGRVRLALSEDHERRPSPWVPFLPAYAGRGTGAHWIPEVGDLVVVVAESAYPENLYCIGSVRGKDQKIEQSWQSEKNAVKTLAARNQTVFLMDDQRQIIRLEAGDTCLELSGSGDIRLNGKQIEMDAENKASLTAGKNVKIDAARVDLG